MGGDEVHGGACYSTSHSLTHPLDSSETTWESEGEIKEFHFHTYWFQDSHESYAAALRIQSELIQAVSEGKFVVVLPGINEEAIPRINTEPFGPHPCGSFETWVPKEYLGEAMSFFMQRRGELSILLQPLSRWVNEDHWGRSMWLGQPHRLNFAELPNNMEVHPAQYPELK